MKNFSFAHVFISAGYVLSILLLSVDSYKSTDTVLRYLGASSTFFAGAYLLLILFLNIFKQKQWQAPQMLERLNALAILPITTVVTVVMTMADMLTHENFVFSMTSLHYHQLSLVMLFSAVFFFLIHKERWTSARGRFILFTLPLALASYFVLADAWPFNYFIEMSKEDRIIEWSQFFVLLVAAVYTAKTTWKLRKKHVLYAWMYAAITFALLITAGDEISWGQRLIGFATPDQIADRNVQGEITLHNLDILSTLMWQAYFIVSVYGSFAWLFKPSLKKHFPTVKKGIDLVVPPWYTSLYFFFLLNYQIRTRPGVTHIMGYWGESIELLLYIGAAIFFWQVYEET